jgi:hypothetical protein
MHAETIKEIERALTYHSNYNGDTTDRYLAIMDRLAGCYSGSKSQKVSKLLDDYYKAVGVESLSEAIARLKKIRGE